jgi:hypothetical protein
MKRDFLDWLEIAVLGASIFALTIIGALSSTAVVYFLRG